MDNRTEISEILRVVFILLLISLSVECCAQQMVSSESPIGVEKVLSWLPHDTETVIVAHHPWTIPKTNQMPAALVEEKNYKLTDQDVAEVFTSLPLGLFTLKDGMFLRSLAGKHLVLAAEGSRHFRSPANLGLMPYEGCAIAVFSEDLKGDGKFFSAATRKAALRAEQISGTEVLVFQEKLEGDIWTTYVAFPTEHVVLAASNRDYLQQVLARISGEQGPRALSDSLIEWKFLDRNSPFWGLRHYDRSQQELDPSSPFGGQRSANFPDEQATGAVFSLDSLEQHSVQITYISADTSVIKQMQKRSFMILEGEAATKKMRIRFTEPQVGALRGIYLLDDQDAISLFVFQLEGLLGHAVYL